MWIGTACGAAFRERRVPLGTSRQREEPPPTPNSDVPHGRIQPDGKPRWLPCETHGKLIGVNVCETVGSGVALGLVTSLPSFREVLRGGMFWVHGLPMNVNRWVWRVLLCLAPVFGVSAQARPSLGKLRGVAYDSVRAQPLALATIQLVNTRDRGESHAIRADSLGRFGIDGLEPGTWIVGALHPSLDSLAVDELSARVDVKATGTSRMVIAVPSGRALVARVCGDAAARDSSGYVHGLLRDMRSVESGAPGTVRVQWVEFTLKNARLERSLDGVEVLSTATGRYPPCQYGVRRDLSPN